MGDFRLLQSTEIFCVVSRLGLFFTIVIEVEVSIIQLSAEFVHPTLAILALYPGFLKRFPTKETEHLRNFTSHTVCLLKLLNISEFFFEVLLFSSTCRLNSCSDSWWFFCRLTASLQSCVTVRHDFITELHYTLVSLFVTT